MATFHVCHIPSGYFSLEGIRVIDSWSSDSNLLEAFEVMKTKLQEYSNTYGDGSVQVYEIDTSLGYTLPPAQVNFLIEMSMKAMPKNDEDESYFDDANAYFDVLSKRWPIFFDDRTDFADYCNGATGDEMVIESRRILSQVLKVLPPYVEPGAIQKEWEQSYQGKILQSLGFVYHTDSTTGHTALIRQVGKHIIKLTDPENANRVPNHHNQSVDIKVYSVNADSSLDEIGSSTATDFFDLIAHINSILMWS